MGLKMATVGLGLEMPAVGLGVGITTAGRHRDLVGAASI